LEAIDLTPYLHGVEHVTVSGESGREARACNYDWVLAIREQCVEAGITFWFKGTGSKFVKDGVTQTVNPYRQGSLAKELGIDIIGDRKLF
jgi:protein gp37